jgi:GT2 family glycosyltransferase
VVEKSLDPLVSVVILNYRRLETLAGVLESVMRQEYPHLEVVVVDNGSGDDAVSRIKQRFPTVKIVALPENIGTAARNRGIEAARGEVIVMLDNDVSFDDPHSVRRILRALERHPRAGCVVFRVYHPATGKLHLRDWCHPRPWKDAELEEFETHYITEGAAAFRKEVFRSVEPYWPPLFIGHEGFDLAVRMMDAGFEIWYVPEVRVWHAASVETRQDWRPFYYYTRNLFPIVYRNFPWRSMLPYTIPRIFVLGLYSIRARSFLRHLRGVQDGLALTWKYRSVRKPVCRATLSRIRRLKRAQAGLLARFALAKERIMPLFRHS